MRVFFPVWTKKRGGSFLLCSYPGRISFAGFFSSFFFVIACFEGVFLAGLPGPGDRIEARCTRCNDITGHVIVALVGGEIVKVECRACGSVHKYYPPATPKEAKGKTAVCRVKAGETRKEAVNSFKPTSTPSTAAASPAAVSRAAAKAQKAAEDMEQNWQSTMNMTAASARPYAMNESFAVGDVIDHPKFGSGVVQEIFPPDKMQILFRDGAKMLRCAC